MLITNETFSIFHSLINVISFFSSHIDCYELSKDRCAVSTVPYFLAGYHTFIRPKIVMVYLEFCLLPRPVLSSICIDDYRRPTRSSQARVSKTDVRREIVISTSQRLWGIHTCICRHRGILCTRGRGDARIRPRNFGRGSWINVQVWCLRSSVYRSARRTESANRSSSRFDCEESIERTFFL